MANINSTTQRRIIETLADHAGTLSGISYRLPDVPVNTIRGSLTKLAKRGEVVRQGRTWYRATPSQV